MSTTEGKIIEVAAHLKMPANTLRNWVRGGKSPVEPEELDEARQELDELLEDEMQEIFKEMRLARKDASYRDLSIALGIMFDKRQLLHGNSTENVRQQVTFVREGLSSLPEQPAPRAIEDNSGDVPF